MTDDNLIDDATRDDAAQGPGARFGWAHIAVAILFGFIYAYYLWDAVRTLVELPGYYELIGLSGADVPWWLLIANLLIPVVLYLAAFLAGRRRSAVGLALVFLLGLAALAALSLSVIAIEAVIRP